MFIGVNIGIPSYRPILASSPPPPTFVPTDLAQLAGWWDASDSAYTTGNVALATNGQPVTQLRDKSGANRHLTATTTPSFAAAAINGKGALQFNGSATIQSSNAFVYDVHHVFAVVKALGSDKDILGSDNTTADNILLQVDTGRKAKAHYWSSAGAQTAVHGTTINDNDIVIVEQWQTATTLNVAINGGAPVTTVLAGTKGGTTRPIVLGSRSANAGTARWTGQIAEVVLTTVTALTTEERTDCYNYLYNKWFVAGTAGQPMGLLLALTRAN